MDTAIILMWLVFKISLILYCWRAAAWLGKNRVVAALSAVPCAPFAVFYWGGRVILFPPREARKPIRVTALGVVAVVCVGASMFLMALQPAWLPKTTMITGALAVIFWTSLSAVVIVAAEQRRKSWDEQEGQKV